MYALRPFSRKWSHIILILTFWSQDDTFAWYVHSKVCSYMKIPSPVKMPCPSRSVEFILQCHQDFLRAGEIIKTQAKLYLNCIGPPFCTIPSKYLISINLLFSFNVQVCLPGLHITQGIWWKKNAIRWKASCFDTRWHFLWYICWIFQVHQLMLAKNKIKALDTAKQQLSVLVQH